MMVQPAFFTIDMEMKLISLLRSGNLDQIEEMINQIRTMYLYQGMESNTYRHMVETLRGCVFRSIPGKNEGEKDGKLSDAAAKAHSAREVFDVMRQVGAFWAESTKEREEIQLCMDKEEIAAYIEEHYGDADLTLNMVAEWAGESERKLYNAFKGIFGVSFSSYLEQIRMTHACELLKQGAAVKDIAAQVGYSSDYSFRRAFKRMIGVSPSDYRKCQKE
jgi:AraC-like DNA-binding protein